MKMISRLVSRLNRRECVETDEETKEFIKRRGCDYDDKEEKEEV